MGTTRLDSTDVVFSRKQYERRRLVLLLMPVVLCLYVMLSPKVFGTRRHIALIHLVCPCAWPLYLEGTWSERRNAATLLEREPGSFVAVDYWEYQESLAPGSTPIPGEFRAEMSAFTTPTTIGLVAPILSGTRVEVFIRSGTAQAPDLSEAELIQARLAMADFLASSPSRQNQHFATLLRTRTGEVHEIVWGGLLHDAVFLVLVVSWFRMPLRRGFALRDWRRYRRSRARRSRRTALDANRCPACQYNISGLPQGPQHQCPECSEALWR